MRPDDYINSGKLQDYCLGLLTEEEEKEVEAMCREYPEVARELLLLHLSLEKYVGINNRRRLAELRREIWEAIKKSRKENP